MTLHPRRAAALVFALLVALGTSACTAESPSSVPAADEQVATGTAVDGAGDTGQNATAEQPGDTGRAFNSSDDAVIEAIETALKSDNADAKWDGKVLRIQLDGSVEKLTAYIPCSAAEALIADDESVILVFSDGDLICNER